METPFSPKPQASSPARPDRGSGDLNLTLEPMKRGKLRQRAPYQAPDHAPQASARPATRPQHSPAGFVPPRRKRAPASSARRATRSSPAWLALILVFLWAALLTRGVVTGRLPLLALAAIVILNLVTFVVYWQDKVAAQGDGWRTSESTLHLFGFLGGWPGAWIAQQTLRHKSSKASFRQAYWSTVVLNFAVLAAWIFWAGVQPLLFNL